MLTPRKPRPGAALAEDVYRLLFRARRLLWTATARCLEERGESVFTWQVYCKLARNGPAMQLDLAAACAQDPAGMSRVLDDMEARRLVRRRADPGDRRRSLVEPTAAGDAWFAEIDPVVTAVMDDAMRDLSGRQRAQLRRLLSVLVTTHERPSAPAGRARAAPARRAARPAAASPSGKRAARGAAAATSKRKVQPSARGRAARGGSS